MTEQRPPVHDRVTTRFSDELLDQLDSLVETGAYANRSEAIRAAVRQLAAQHDNHTEAAKPDE